MGEDGNSKRWWRGESFETMPVLMFKAAFKAGQMQNFTTFPKNHDATIPNACSHLWHLHALGGLQQQQPTTANLYMPCTHAP
jgi:hypothetical protein